MNGNVCVCIAVLWQPNTPSVFFCGKQEELEAGSIMSSLIALQRQVGKLPRSPGRTRYLASSPLTVLDTRACVILVTKQV